MQIFQLNERYTIVCDALNTRNGFKHEAQLMLDGYEIGDKVKVFYINRTWEKFAYETVIHKLLEKTTRFTDAEKEQFKTELNTKYGY